MWDAVSGGSQPQPWFHNIIYRLTGVRVRGKLLAPPSPRAQHKKSGAPCTRDSHGKLPPAAHNQKRNTLKAVFCVSMWDIVFKM